MDRSKKTCAVNGVLYLLAHLRMTWVIRSSQQTRSNHSTNMKKLSIICLMGILSVGGINALRADDSKPAKEEKSTETTQRSIPFHGKIESLDPASKSIKVGTRVFVVSETTKITKAGKASSFEEAKVGEEVGGAYRDTAGKLELTSLRVGP